MRKPLTILLTLAYLLTAGLGGGFWIVCSETDHSSHVEPQFGLCCDQGDETAGESRRSGDSDHDQAPLNCKTCVDSPLVIDSTNSSVSSAKIPALQAAPDFWALPPAVPGSCVLWAAAIDYWEAVCGTSAISQSLSTEIMRC